MTRSALPPLVTVVLLVAAGPVHAAAQALLVQVGTESATVVPGQHSLTAQRSPASESGLHGSRIRTDSPVIGMLIRDASERSETFRELVAAIDASDGIVYVRIGTCGRLRA